MLKVGTERKHAVSYQRSIVGFSSLPSHTRSSDCPFYIGPSPLARCCLGNGCALARSFFALICSGVSPDLMNHSLIAVFRCVRPSWCACYKRRQSLAGVSR
jgi:hypothetical protein